MVTSYKDFKYYHILNLINHFGPISRTEIIKMTDYRSGSVGDIVKEMIDFGIVTETGLSSVGHGRSRVLLEINNSNLCALGISFPSKRVIVEALLSDGTSLNKIECKLPENAGKGLMIRTAIESCTRLLEGLKDKSVLGIGVAVPSYNPTPHMRDTLKEDFIHFNDWITIDLKDQLEKGFNLDVYCSPSISLPAILEKKYGEARNAQTFMCIELSNGIGSSLICNGRPLKGAKGSTGSIGHTVVDINCTKPTACNCGKMNCVEATAAWPAIKRNLIHGIENGAYSLLLPIYKKQGDFLARDVKTCIENDDKLCKYYVREAARIIGTAVANEIAIIDPEVVIFHSFMLELGEYFTNCLQEVIYDNLMPLFGRPRLVFSDNYESILSGGAAAEVFSRFMRSNEFDWIYLSEKN